MENASKALIIAGAILISILLISVGIIVMNAINDPVSNAGDVASSQAVQTFNSQFTAYAGSEVDYNTAKQCITAVKSAAGGEHSITLDSNGIVSETGLKRGEKYDIEFTDNAPSGGTADGYYDKCLIKKHATTTP